MFYRPKDGYVGDVMPYYFNDEYVFFYLKTQRKGEIFTDIVWHMVKTKDFVNYYDDKCLSIRGGTGSILINDDKINIFYCDNSDQDLSPEKKQYACHAITRDYEQITEINKFSSSGNTYDRNNFRDPHVFWNEEYNEYWMLLASREKNETNRQGCVGLFTSKDLVSWEEKSPLYAPRIDVGAHECPDIFKIGDWWYLTYSTYTGFYATVYRMSKTIDGPWIIPPNEAFDTRCFYAGKTVTNGNNRYIVGWNPSRVAPYYSDWNPKAHVGNDYNVYDWGGNIIVHQIVQNPDGTLGVKLPDQIEDQFSLNLDLSMNSVFNDWIFKNNAAKIKTDKFSAVISNKLQGPCLIKAEIFFDETMSRCGFFLRANNQLDKAYYITLNKQNNALEFSSYLFQDDQGWRFIPYSIDLERPYVFKSNTSYKISIITNESICLIYMNDELALSSRTYDLSDGNFGFFTIGGEVEFKNLQVRTLNYKINAE